MIPKQFKLLNYTWTVVMNPGPVRAEDGDMVKGLCDYDRRTITLDATLEPVVLWHAWHHELMHAVFYALGRYEQSDDEGLVDSVGGALAQVFPCPYEQFALTLGN